MFKKAKRSAYCCLNGTCYRNTSINIQFTHLVNKNTLILNVRDQFECRAETFLPEPIYLSTRERERDTLGGKKLEKRIARVESHYYSHFRLFIYLKKKKMNADKVFPSC